MRARVKKGRDIQHLKEDITIDEVVVYLGGQIPHQGGSWASWIPVKCPFHQDADASASLNRQIGRFKCHACDSPRADGKAGDILDLAMEHLQSHDVKQAMAWLERTFG